MAGLADIIAMRNRAPARDKRLVDINGQPLELGRPHRGRDARARTSRTIAGVPIHDDEQLTQWLQSHVDAQAAQAGAPPQNVTELAPDVSSRRRYALQLMRERLAPEVGKGSKKYQRKVRKTLADLEAVELGI